MPLIIDPKTGLPVPRRTDRAPRRGRKAIRIPGPADIDQVPAGVARDPGLDVDPKAFGSGVGEAVADFGQAVARLASPLDRMNRRNDEAFAAAGLAALHERQTRAGLEARKDTSGGGAGFHDGRMAAFDKDLGEVLKRAPSTVAREILKSQGAALRDLMSGGAARFEATARIVERRANLDRELGNLSALARQDPDDHALHRALLENLLGAASNELSADKMAPFRAAEERRLAEASVRGFIDRGDVPSARALLEAVGRDGPAGEAAPLSPEKAGALRRNIERTADEARRAERRAVDALMEDHLVSLQNTGAGLGGIAERARAALDGKAFKAFQRDEKDAHAFHETMKSLKFARPEVIERELATRRPKEGARNFADRQRRFRVLERGAKQMLNLRARDGAAFVMEMEDVKATVEGAGTDGPDLRRALKFRMAMQSEIGIPEHRVRLLTRAEAGALADQVQSASTQDKATKVAGLQDLYGPLFGRAMKELSDEGLDPRFRVLAMARDNPALARTIAKALEPGGAGPEQTLDPAGSQKVRGRVRDLTADARPDADPEGETADGIDAILSAADALGVEYLRQSGRVEESAARAAAFANGAIEEMLLTAADVGEGDDDSLTGNGHESPAQQGNAENGANSAQADNAKSMPQSQVSQAQVSQGHPWPASPVRPKFGDELNKRESRKDNYQEENPGQAWGRYQMTKTALKDLGMMDANGNWTGKHGIHDKDEFLKNPQVQEKVLAEYMKRNLDQLRANGALGDMGQKISGVKAQITVTESGLLAAAHRQGAGMVKQYLDHQRRHNWTTNPKTFPKNKKDQFLSVETRLREFQNVPVWKP